MPEEQTLQSLFRVGHPPIVNVGTSNTRMTVEAVCVAFVG